MYVFRGFVKIVYSPPSYTTTPTPILFADPSMPRATTRSLAIVGGKLPMKAIAVNKVQTTVRGCDGATIKFVVKQNC